MTLYHGSNADIDCIDLTRGLRYKDFGKGFYLTSSRDTAVRMAQKKERSAPCASSTKPASRAYEPAQSSSDSHLPDRPCAE